MREIKFRAWDETNKRMYTQSFELNWKGEITRTYGLYPSPSLILMQYTGLKDKSGKEIYEGDVLDGDTYTGKVIIKFGAHETSTDYYACNAYGFYGLAQYDNTYSLDCCLHSEDAKIIGNIYENPELLEKND